MPTIRNDARQSTLVAEQVLTYADLPNGVASTIKVAVPAGAIVLGGAVVTEVPISGGGITAATVDVGDSSSANKFVDNANIFAAGSVVFTGRYLKQTDGKDITFTPAYTGGTIPTAGRIRAVVEYIIVGRGQESAT